MDLLTRHDLVSLAQSRAAGPSVSLYMPTHRSGDAIQGDPLRWKNLVNGAERQLVEGLGARDAAALLAPARELQDDGAAWHHMSDGLAMFLRPDSHETFRVPAPLPELVTVGDRWVVGPLMRLLSGDEHFLVLALSQGEVRLLAGGRHTVEEVHLVDVPTSLRDVAGDPEDPPAAMARPSSSASRGDPAVFYGHGATDDRARDEDVRRFLRQIDAGLSEVLTSQSAPLVLVGLERLVAVYREISTYPGLMSDALLQNPNQLSAQELHAKAWPIVERRLREERGGAMERVEELRGAGRASSELDVVAGAAAQGRVETLFVTAGPWCWNRVSGNEPAVVALGADDAYAGCEAVDTAATDALINDGHVYITSQRVAQDSDVAAVFRY